MFFQVLGSIFLNANFGGLIHTKLYSGFKRESCKWTMRLNLSN